jgi:hypothetical protein
LPQSPEFGAILRAGRCSLLQTIVTDRQASRRTNDLSVNS